MNANDLTNIARVLDIAAQIHQCDFRVVIGTYAVSPNRKRKDEQHKLVICVGEPHWSRCLTVANLESDDPTIQLLVDDGRDLTRMLCGDRPAIERELPLSEFMANNSEFMANNYISVRRNLDEPNHRNGRLA